MPHFFGRFVTTRASLVMSTQQLPVTVKLLQLTDCEERMWNNTKLIKNISTGGGALLHLKQLVDIVTRTHESKAPSNTITTCPRRLSQWTWTTTTMPSWRRRRRRRRSRSLSSPRCKGSTLCWLSLFGGRSIGVSFSFRVGICALWRRSPLCLSFVIIDASPK